MVEFESSLPSHILSRVRELEDTWGDGGCWREVLVSAAQRASALSLLPEEERLPKAVAIDGVLSHITGHHDPDLAKRLCQQLEEILPLSR